MSSWEHLQDAGRSREFWAGVQAELPLLLGVVPFGLVYGVLGLQAGLPMWAVIAMSAVLFGGASQVVFAQLWGALVPSPVIIGTVGVVNLRHLLYSASITPLLGTLPRRWKLLLAYLLTDEAYMAAVGRLANGPQGAYRHWFLLGTGFILWLGWQIASVLGVLLGATIPAGWSLEFSIALTFIALLAPNLHRRSELFAAFGAGTTALLTQALPYKLWIVLAAVVGMAVGMLTSRFDKKKAAP